MSSPLAPWVKIKPDGTIDFTPPTVAEPAPGGILEKVSAFVRENPLLSLGGAALATYLVVRR